MRITISHKQTKTEIMEKVDRSFGKIFQGASGLPLQFVVEQKSWQGSILSFLINAKMGMLSTPIRGTVEVTDQDVTVDADLRILSRFLPEEEAKEMLGKGIKGLLN